MCRGPEMMMMSGKSKKRAGWKEDRVCWCLGRTGRGNCSTHHYIHHLPIVCVCVFLCECVSVELSGGSRMGVSVSSAPSLSTAFTNFLAPEILQVHSEPFPHQLFLLWLDWSTVQQLWTCFTNALHVPSLETKLNKNCAERPVSWKTLPGSGSEIKERKELLSDRRLTNNLFSSGPSSTEPCFTGLKRSKIHTSKVWVNNQQFVCFC